MKKILIAGLIIIALLALIAGCKTGEEKFGEAPEKNAAKTAVGTIIVNASDYINKDVTIEGTITSECPAGGWINVRDNSGGTIYVEMHGSSFAPIPQRVGKNVIVKGSVYQTESTPQETKLLGKGLIIN